MNETTTNESVANQYILQSVTNALSIIDLLGEYEELSVSEVAKHMNIGKTTAFRLLATLESSGYICKYTSAKYRLSMKLAMLGTIVTKRNEIANISHPFLEDISSYFKETVHMVVWNSDSDIIVVDRVIGSSPISYHTNIGYITRPAHIAASGQVLLAFTEEERVLRYLSQINWEQYSGSSIPDSDSLRALLSKVRENKMATNDGDVIPGLYCFAIPVFGYNGHAIASLSIAGTETNLKNKREEMIARLNECSLQIHQQICLGLE